LDGIEGWVESSNSCWSVNISVIAHVCSEIETCIINDAGRQKPTNIHVL
jgi:hypothetical protein